MHISIIRRSIIHHRYFMLSILSFFILLFSFILHFSVLEAALAKNQDSHHQVQNEQDKSTSTSKVGGKLANEAKSINSNSNNNNNNNNFLTYTNKQFGFTMLYPSSWIKEQFKLTEEGITFDSNNPVLTIPQRLVRFDSNEAPLLDFTVGILKVASHLDVNDSKIKASTPHDYVLKQLKYMEKAVAEIPVYIPVRNMPVIVGAADNKYPAWRLEYLSSSSFSKEQSEHSDYIIEIYTVVGDKLYVFGLQSPQLMIPQTLPVAQKMINSIRFFPQLSSASNLS